MGATRTSKILWTGRHVQAIGLGVCSWGGSTSIGLANWAEFSGGELLEEDPFADIIWKWDMDSTSGTSKTVLKNHIPPPFHAVPPPLLEDI